MSHFDYQADVAEMYDHRVPERTRSSARYRPAGTTGYDYQRTTRDRQTDQVAGGEKLRTVKARPGTRRGLVLALGGAVTTFAALTALPWLGGNMQDALRGPALAQLLIPCGHNGDSAERPTVLHAFVDRESVFLLEIPAGDSTKSQLQTLSLAGLGYTGGAVSLRLDAPKQAGIYTVLLTVGWSGHQYVWRLMDRGSHFGPEGAK